MFGVLHPALLPSLPTDTASPVLTQMNCPQSNPICGGQTLQRGAGYKPLSRSLLPLPPLSPASSAPSLPELSHQHTNMLTISHLNKQTNSPLVPHPLHIGMLSLLSLPQKASRTVYTAHVSL